MQGSWFDFEPANSLGHVVHTQVPLVTKQCNFVRASSPGIRNGWWRGVVGEAFRMKRSCSMPGLVST